MTLTKTTVNISAATLSTETDSHHKSMCLPSEVHVIRLLMNGVLSGKIKEYPVLVRAFRKKGWGVYLDAWCEDVRKELEEEHFELNPYCNGLP